MTDKPMDDKGQVLDPLAEIEAMRKVATALETLEATSRDRVLDWALKFYRGKAATIAAGVTAIPRTDLASTRNSELAELPNDIATLFASANPGTEPEKALVAAYWLLKHEGVEETDSFRLNSELTHLGHRVSNITRALGMLITAKPALIVQTRKEGKTKQARKKYKLTIEGMRRVERMIAGGNGSDS